MPPKTKDKHLPPIRIEEELLLELIRCADLDNKTVSEYIRAAIREKNERTLRKKGKE
jgi:hypothetical protein